MGSEEVAFVAALLREIRARKRLLLGAGVFSAGILLLTKLDHIVNSTLYGFGLQFSMDWYWQYSVAYLFLLQGLVLLAYLFSRSRELLLFAEAFVLSGTQDLVYFGIWNGGDFPSGQWSWTPYFQLFGSWTNLHQVLLSAACLMGASLVIFLHLRKAGAKELERPVDMGCEGKKRPDGPLTPPS